MRAIKNVFKNSKALITFITAGDPSPEATLKFLLALEENSDIIELGIPFSDPMADGKTIQKANYRALEEGIRVVNVFEIVKNFRDYSDKPVILMTYYNPVYVKGEEKFVRMAKEAGVNGLIVVDLPVEESKSYVEACRRYKVGTVFLAAPNTPDARLKAIDELSSAFVYLVSLYGTTGAREEIPPIAFEFLRRARNICEKPLCVGFGISKEKHVRELTKIADGVVVGSALVRIIEEYGNSEKTVEKLKEKTGELKRGLL